MFLPVWKLMVYLFIFYMTVEGMKKVGLIKSK